MIILRNATKCVLVLLLVLVSFYLFSVCMQPGNLTQKKQKVDERISNLQAKYLPAPNVIEKLELKDGVF